MAEPGLLFASSNSGKVREARDLAAQFELELLVLQDLRGKADPIPQVEESAPDYRGNAVLKARAFYAWAGHPTIADDSGLEVFALGGEPGVKSARYAGVGLPFERNIEHLLSKLSSADSRSARFVCHIAFIDKSGQLHHFGGELSGQITSAPRGEGGFGYDSIFQPVNSEHTLAEIKGRGQGIKTHRVLALERCFEYIRKIAP